MRSVVNMFSVIVHNSKGKKRFFKLKCSLNNTKYLDILNQLNILEYSKSKNLSNVYDVKLMFYRNVPNIHSITLLNNNLSKGLSLRILNKELNSKKAMYIVRSPKGIRLVNSINSCSNISLILFRINLT